MAIWKGSHNPTEMGTYQPWLLTTYWVSMYPTHQPHVSTSPQHPRCFSSNLGLQKMKKKTLRNTGKKRVTPLFQTHPFVPGSSSKSGEYKCICPAFFFGRKSIILICHLFLNKEMCLDVFNFKFMAAKKSPGSHDSFELICHLSAKYIVASKIPFKLYLNEPPPPTCSSSTSGNSCFPKKTTPWHSDRRHRLTSSARRCARTWPSGFPKDSERSGRSPRRRWHPHCRVDPQTCEGEFKKTWKKMIISEKPKKQSKGRLGWVGEKERHQL